MHTGISLCLSLSAHRKFEEGSGWVDPKKNLHIRCIPSAHSGQFPAEVIRAQWKWTSSQEAMNSLNQNSTVSRDLGTHQEDHTQNTVLPPRDTLQILAHFTHNQ